MKKVLKFVMVLLHGILCFCCFCLFGDRLFVGYFFLAFFFFFKIQNTLDLMDFTVNSCQLLGDVIVKFFMILLTM